VTAGLPQELVLA